MIEVELPDGAVVEFPDDTPPDVMQAALRQQFGSGQAPAAPEPRETTGGEFAQGLGLSLAKGSMRATKSIPDLASFVLPDAWTDPWSEFFERGMDSAEALKPEAFKEEAKRGFIAKDAQGGFEGLQLPSAEALLGTGVESLPMVPFFLAGGGGTATALRSIPALANAGKGAEVFGYGLTNAAMVAPDQWRQTYQEALSGDPMRGIKPVSEEEARQRANWAASWTAALTQSTGSAGGAVAQKLGAESSNIASAVLKGFMGEAPFEGVEESGQNIISDLAVSRPIDWLAAADVGMLAATAGGAPGAGVAGLEYMTQPSQQPAPAPPVEPAPVTPEPVAPVQEQDAFDVLTQRINEAAQANQQAAPEIPQPTVIDPVQEARERLRTMMPQTEPEATIPGPEAPIVPQEPGPVRESKFKMPETGTTQGDVSLPLYRFVGGEELNAGDDFGMHWTHDRAEVEQMASDEPGYIITAGHPGYENIMDWENPSDRPIMEREIGGYEYRDKVFPEVPVRPGTKINVTSIEQIDSDFNRRWIKEPSAPVRESQPVQQEPTPVQERTEAPADEELTPEQVAEIEAKLTNVKQPPTLLDAIAGLRIRLDRKKFRGDLAQQENLQVGNKWLYEGDRSEFEGMGPDELLEWMQQEGWLPENTPDAPNQVTVNDAVDLLNRALRGERIVHDNDMDAELDYQQARQYEIDKAAGEGFGANPEEFAQATQYGRTLDETLPDEEIDAQIEAAWNATESTGSMAWLEETSDVDQGTVQGSSVEGGQAETLIPEPTQAEQLRAEAERKTAERNRLGQDEVPVEQGEGELFAGNEAGVRPTQNTIFTEEAVDAARTRLKSKLGTARSGVDPEMLKDMAIVAGYHIEKGARTFQAFSKAMIDDLGDRIKPHLAKLWEENKPPDVPSEPKQAAAPAPEEGKTSAKNAVTNAEREARNKSPAFFSFRESNAELVGRAEQELKDNPDAAQELISRLLDEADPSINRLDLAILMVYKTDIRQAMARQGARLQNKDLTAEQRAVVIKKISDLDVTMDEIDQAAVVAGAVWGGWGQLRSKFILEDYTLETQIARTSQMIQSAVTPEMKAFLEEATNRISRLENELADQNRKMQDEIDRRVSAEVQIQMAKRIAGEMKKPAQTVKKKLRDVRNAEIEWLKQHSAQLNALPVEHVYHLARLGGVIMAEGAVEFAVWVERLKQYLGGKLFGQIEDSIDEIYALAQDEYHKVESEVERPSVDDVLVEAEALAEIDEPVTHKVVYKLVEAFLAQGLRGESQVMQAVHGALEPFYPDLTESDVRHLFTEYGKAKFPSEEELKVLAREMKVLVRLGISIERLQKGLAPLRTGPQRDKATQKIREKQRVLNWLMREMDRKNPNPTRRSLASINEQRVRRLENQIADLEKQIKTGEKPPKRKTPLEDSPEVAALKKKRDALKKHLADIEAAKKPELSPEEKYNVLRGKQLRRQLADIRRRLRDKDYARHPRKQMPALSRENVELQGEIAKAKFELHMKQMEWQRENMSGFQKTWDATKQFSSLARASMTSTDLSAVGRQGGFLLYASPNTARKAFMPMIRAIRSDADAHAIMEEIKARPNYRYMQAAKLFFSDQMSIDWKSFEEAFQSRWQEHFPHIKISARAYTAFLNKLRADNFDAIYNRLTRSGPLTKEELLDLGDLINNATGRADLGRFSSEGISSIFFAPRWVISRFNMILYPLKAAGMLPGKSGKRMSAKMRKEVARQLVNFVSSYIIIWGLLGFMFGDEADEDDPLISFDPFSPDFAKLKIGNTRMDITAGLSNAIRFTAMSLDAAWDAVSGTGEIDDARRYGRYLMRFMWSKLAPIPSSTVNAMVGHNVIGETPKERGEFLSETLKMPDWLAENRVLLEVLGWSIPLSLRDFYDSAVDAGIPPAIAFQVFSTLGWGIVTYERDEDKKEGRPERPERPQRPSRPERPERG